jgi:uncharacterized protein (TIGR00725 family)
MKPPLHRRRPVLAVVGNAGELPPAVEAAAEAVGRAAVDAGFRIVTGGLGGVMAAASRGARQSPAWRDGDVLGVLPGYDRSAANPWVDVVIPSGAQLMRNVLVAATADCVAMMGGGAGTLSEAALAWQLGRPVVALRDSGGWAERLAGEAIDARRSDVVAIADDPAALVTRALELVAAGAVEAGDVGSGWKRR